MQTFGHQPTGMQVGTLLKDELESGRWDVFEAGVAWVRRSGTKHLMNSLSKFLKKGGIAQITIGIDMDNTSKEGLEDLLSLKNIGLIELFVFHNENGPTFHPKVYVFHTKQEALLLVGSNNLTEAGLFSNTEAHLAIRAPFSDPVIQDALSALASWKDPTSTLARPLDSVLIGDLVSQGYLQTEVAINRQTRTRAAQAATPQGAQQRVLFGTRRPSVPAPQWTPAAPTAPRPRETVALAVGQVLLMRLRKAHVVDRPTQTQIPKDVFEGAFFRGVATITSSHSGESHDVIYARARGIVNTLKLEIPEMRGFKDPVIRFERTPGGVQYSVYDANSLLGKPIKEALDRGLNMNPPTTYMTKPRTPQSSTWWRFV
jgi:HKD family nuclease